MNSLGNNELCRSDVGRFIIQNICKEAGMRVDVLSFFGVSECAWRGVSCRHVVAI